MTTTTEKKALRKKLEEYEGRIEYIYKDSKGYMTVGVGHLLKDLNAAQKLSFIHQSDASTATKEEIKQDYDEVQKQAYDTKKVAATVYKKHTKLKVSASEIDRITNEHIDSFEKELKTIYGATKFEKFPSDVKLALFDMIFNLGMTNLKNKFSKFNKAIKSQDWAKAAKESHRADVNSARNDYVKNKLNKAAQTSKAKKIAASLKMKRDHKISQMNHLPEPKVHR